MNFLKFNPVRKSYTLKEQLPKETNSVTAEEQRSALGKSDAEAQISETARTYRLDAIGQVCPFPLVEAKRAVAQIGSGDYLTIDFDCTQATDSIPAWAADAGHSITDFHQIDDATWSITLRKG